MPPTLRSQTRSATQHVTPASKTRATPQKPAPARLSKKPAALNRLASHHTRSPKRSRPSIEIGERPQKRRRRDDEPRSAGDGSRAKLKGRSRTFERAVSEFQRMRLGTKDVKRLVVETEGALARAVSNARELLTNIKLLDTRHEKPLEEPFRHVINQIPSPARDNPTTSTRNSPRSPDHASTTPARDFKAFIAAVKDAFNELRPKIRDATSSALPNEDLSNLCELCEDCAQETALWHSCRQDFVHKNRIDAERFLQPRPRIGVDEHGHAFHDYIACQTEIYPPKRTVKENIMMDLLGLHFFNDVESDVLVLPTPLCPRRPRIFAEQYKLQFHHIPQTVYQVLERWHLGYGRCLHCILRAMRTFPPWIVTVSTEERFNDGDPVFANNADDEVAEWDEVQRRWQHLVLDHYRWVPVHDLQQRPSDATANPKVLNGTIDTPIPIRCWG